MRILWFAMLLFLPPSKIGQYTGPCVSLLLVYARPFGHTFFDSEATLPAIFAPASVVFEALARQKLPGWQPATSCPDPRTGHSYPLAQHANVSSILYPFRKCKYFFAKNQTFFALFSCVCMQQLPIYTISCHGRRKAPHPPSSTVPLPLKGKAFGTAAQARRSRAHGTPGGRTTG